MDRGPISHLLSGLVAPLAVVLVASALSLPLQPYTGLSLREDRVAAVFPDGPGALAGLRPGDRLLPSGGTTVSGRGALRDAHPDRPVSLVRERDGERRPVWLVPRPLPAAERRMQVVLLAVACGFTLLGGWVWSERRDRLTRPFFLLCLAFAFILTPLPLLGASLLSIVYDLIYTAAQLFLPALLIHFFALFPETREARGALRADVRAGYLVATALFALSLLALALQMNGATGEPVLAVLQPIAALWFAAGVLLALGLFARSFVRHRSADTRRRLVVAFAGCVLGLGPLAVVIALRNLHPAAEVPGERAAVILTLLVPATFAWGVVVHRLFDFRVALQASAAALMLALVAVAAFIAGDWLGGTWLPGQAPLLNGAVLAVLAVVVSLAGPLRPWGRAIAARLSRAGDLQSLGEALRDEPGPRDRAGSAILARAALSLASALRLDRCDYVALAGDGQWHGTAGLELSPAFASALAGRTGPIPADDSAFDPRDLATLEHVQAHWVLPIADERPIAALLLGRRLAGPWLDRREMYELERLGDRLAVTLENAELREAARTHGAIDREIEEAGAIQAHRLPRRAPVYPTLDCAAAALSSEPVGGDYYDFVERGREFTLAVGDAAGKGLPAALLLAGVQAHFRSEGMIGRDPGQVLHALNRELVHLDQPEKFVGLLCARVDARDGRLSFANAGLTPPLVRRSTGAFEELTAGGTFLGVSADACYPDVSVELRAGDVAIIYTDGLTEARRGEEMFGTERVREVVDRHANRRAAHILEALFDAVRTFADRPLDDLTVLVLKQLADPPRTPSRRAESTVLKWRLASADTAG